MADQVAAHSDFASCPTRRTCRAHLEPATLEERDRPVGFCDSGGTPVFEVYEAEATHRARAGTSTPALAVLVDSLLGLVRLCGRPCLFSLSLLGCDVTLSICLFLLSLTLASQLLIVLDGADRFLGLPL